jgi:hypothetical protein
MFLKKIGLGVVAGTLAMTLATAAQAVVYPIGGPNFFITSGTPFTPSISATFFNSYGAGVNFDDSFTFTIPQNGTGSGSISTSFSSDLNKIVLTDLIINGTSYPITGTSSGQIATVGFVPITAFALNSIRVIGYSVGAGGFSGTATFTAVPEAATWAMMLVGFGALGLTMRRRRVQVSFA